MFILGGQVCAMLFKLMEEKFIIPRGNGQESDKRPFQTILMVKSPTKGHFKQF